MPYRVFTIDLSGLQPEVQLAAPQTEIQELFVLDIPLGNQFKLKVGRNSDFITINRPFSMEPTGESESNEGLYWKNDVAQPGVTVELVVVTGKSSERLGTVI